MPEAGPYEGPPPVAGEDHLLGTVLEDRYRVTNVLGQGGMAIVYDATDERFGRRVVVKVPRPELLRDPGFRQRFETEIRSQAELEHPRIAKVLDRGEHEGIPYVVIQRLGGGSLADRARKAGGRQTPRQVLGWSRAVATTLDFMATQGLVHRDVKPGNILFDDQGNVFLSDFGIVKALGASDTALTMTGIMPGTPNYMAPEQARGHRLTGAADQYALASCVYEMLSGRLPFERATPVIVMASKQIKEPVPLRQAAPDVPRKVAAVVMRGLAREPGDRYPTSAAFAEALATSVDEAEAADQAARAMKLPFAWLIFPALGLVLLALLLLFLTT